MTAGTNRQWRLARRPIGRLKEGDLEWCGEPIGAPGQGQVLVRNVYLSLDPTHRLWMREQATYLPPAPIGGVMPGGIIGVVEQSRHADFREGDVVLGKLGWQEYGLSDGTSLVRLPEDRPAPLTAYLGILGHIGLAAYCSLLDIGQPRPGETLVVTAAAGAVGSLVGQIGKIRECRVVGIAGTDEKCRWIRDELGFDAAINYKTEPLLEALKQHCPEGIDIHFECVGGAALEAALSLINRKARIVLCGMISQYNAAGPVPGPANLINVIFQRARIEGFLILDHWHRADEAMADLGRWLAEGKIRYRVDVVEGLEKAPAALNKLFDGSNTGKLIVRISPEPQAWSA